MAKPKPRPSSLDAMLSQPLCRGHRQPAAQFVRAVLESVLPDGVPPSWVSIDEAHYVGFGRNAVAHATVTMFDGLTAKVEVQSWGESHRHRWADMPGGDASFEDGKWVRIDRETLEPLHA